jgi:hypothetical protein
MNRVVKMFSKPLRRLMKPSITDRPTIFSEGVDTSNKYIDNYMRWSLHDTWLKLNNFEDKKINCFLLFFWRYLRWIFQKRYIKITIPDNAKWCYMVINNTSPYLNWYLLFLLVSPIPQVLSSIWNQCDHNIALTVLFSLWFCDSDPDDFEKNSMLNLCMFVLIFGQYLLRRMTWPIVISWN